MIYIVIVSQCHNISSGRPERTMAFVMGGSSRMSDACRSHCNLLSRNPARLSVRTLTYAFSYQLLVLRRGICGFVRNIGLMGWYFCNIYEAQAFHLTPCIFVLSVIARRTHCGGKSGTATSFHRHCLSGTGKKSSVHVATAFPRLDAFRAGRDARAFCLRQRSRLAFVPTVTRPTHALRQHLYFLHPRITSFAIV